MERIKALDPLYGLWLRIAEFNVFVTDADLKQVHVAA